LPSFPHPNGSTPHTRQTGKSKRALDLALAALVGLGALALYVLTLAPGVVTIFDDSLEFQLLAGRGAIAHPTGYPLYSILLSLIARLLPVGEIAYRANMLSALAAAGAIGLTYLVARAIGARPAGALFASTLFALSPTFWSQATIAEVYSLHILTLAAMVLALLRWRQRWQVARAPAPGWRRPAGYRVLPLGAALLFGLGLAHHRMIVLWAPALLLFVLLYAPPLLRPGRHWVTLLAVVLAPLALYAWLPLRAHVGSIDGTYQEVGFLCWITACQYTGFFADNVLGTTQPPTFWFTLTLANMGWIGAVMALVGSTGLWRYSRPLALFLLVAFSLNAAFAMSYRVPDPEVFWLPVLWVLALLAGYGLHSLLELAARLTRRRQTEARASQAVVAALLFTPLVLHGFSIFPQADRSHIQGPPELNGHDVLAQPLPENAVIIGLLGEVVYLQYLQEAQGLPRVATVDVPADPVEVRFAVVEQALAEGRVPFLTRELPEAGARWSLSALGPLIEVLQAPRLEVPDALWPLELRVTDAVTLAAWSRSPVEQSPLERITLAWRVEAPVSEPLRVSARVVDPQGETLFQNDRTPAREAYPTTFWRPGEVILDTHELPPLPQGAHYLFILYRAADGTEVGRASWQP
jgi:hypothetical protein